MLIERQAGGGDASEATLQAIRDLLETQREFSESIWIDSTNTYFIRRVVYDESTGNYTTTYILADGTAYTPVAPIEPASSGDREVTQQEYVVRVAGTGYSIDDSILRVVIVDANTATVDATIWYNMTTGLVISAPTMAHIEAVAGVQNDILNEAIASNVAIGQQANPAYTSGSGSIISILKGIFTRLLLARNTGASDADTVRTVSASDSPEVTAIGAQTDAAYTSGSGSAISLLKGIFGRLLNARNTGASDADTLRTVTASDSPDAVSLASIDGKLATLGQKNMAGSVPVVIASNQSVLSVSELDGIEVLGSVTSATNLFSIEVIPYRSITVQVTSAGTSCTITYEASNDNTNWFTTIGYDTSYTGAAAGVTTTTTTGLRQFHCGARYFRARVSTYGSGTVSVVASLRNEPITRANVFATIAAAGGIGSLTETAPASDTASSGLNGRLQRVAQNLTGLTTAPGTAIGTLTVARMGVSDGTNFQRLRGDANGRLELSPNIVAPAATQSTANFYVNAAVTVDQNSATSATVPATGGSWISVTNNSGVVCDITIGGTSGVNDGTTILTAIAGDSFTMPMRIAASAVLRVKPRLTALTTADFVAVRVS